MKLKFRKYNIKKYLIPTIISIVVICLIILLLNIFVLSPTNYCINNKTVESSKIPSHFNNFTIAYISDVHIKEKKDVQRFRRIINKLNEKSYDVVLFGGDLYEDKVIETSSVKSILKSIQPTNGKFAVLGDEDSNQVSALLNDTGFEVLGNEKRPIYYQNQTIYLYGMANKVKASVIDDKGYTIVFNHYPDDFNYYYKHTDLQISGHSGGGYFQIPFVGGLVKSENAQDYVSDQYKKGSSTLLISNGLSTTKKMPYKFLAKNEILTITLKTK